MKKTWIVYLGLIPLCIAFFKINELNYTVYRDTQAHIVKHPELLPSSQVAQISSFGFQSVLADMYWLQSIQYIGGNAISESYKKYLYTLLDLITDLDPYFEAPYIIGELLLPSDGQSQEEDSQEEIQNNIKQGELLGKKGVQYFCKPNIIEKIGKEDDLQKIISDEAYKDPCASFKIPYYLAFIYYFYLHDGINAAYYYKISAAQSDAPSGVKVLAAIMQGKGGEREKSLFMFLSLAQSLDQKDESCQEMTSKVQDVYSYLKEQNLPLTGELIQAIERDRDLLFPSLTEKNEDTLLDDAQCSNYLVKAVREISLLYLDQADARYKKDFPEEKSAKTPQKLFDTGYISFLPTDFQQYKDKNYGIIYVYNEDSGRFDYEMGDY